VDSNKGTLVVHAMGYSLTYFSKVDHGRTNALLLDVALDGLGNVYVADAWNHRIRKITPAGAVSTLAGNGEQGFTDGTDVVAQFNQPFGVALDSVGNIYVGDRENHRIRKITIPAP
jgi:DNA-binding beta-propeller fold protein YncE